MEVGELTFQIALHKLWPNLGFATPGLDTRAETVGRLSNRDCIMTRVQLKIVERLPTADPADHPCPSRGAGPRNLAPVRPGARS
jgi:hypothetical protein